MLCVVIDRKPDHADAHFNRANVHVDRGSWALALADYEKAESLYVTAADKATCSKPIIDTRRQLQAMEAAAAALKSRITNEVKLLVDTSNIYTLTTAQVREALAGPLGRGVVRDNKKVRVSQMKCM